MIRLMLRFSAVLLVGFTLGACSNPDPTPELKDPIFRDLSKRAEDHQKAHEEAKAKLADLRPQLAKAEPRSLDLKNLQKEIANEERKLLAAEQAATYYRIRAERRKLVGRIEYQTAFAEGKEWPEPTEYSDYQVNIRLQEAGRNWASRVPRLQDRLPSSTTTPKKEEGASASSGGH